jgi:enterochelin esterase-like enzyme
MEITSVTLRVLAVLLAAAAFGGSVWLWPRLSGGHWRAVLARVGVLLGNQVLSVAAIGLAINAYFGFYDTWADLFGGGGNVVPAIAAGAGTVAAGVRPGRIQVIGTQRVPLPGAGRDRSGGSLQEVLISGGASKLSSPAYVYLPPQYFQKKFAKRRFPAIIALTGYPGSALNLVTRLRLPASAAEAIGRHQMPATVMVLMRPTVAPPRDTECVDVPGGPQAETYFTDDVRHLVAQSYRVGTDAANWGILGGSTGGYCALKLAMRHPEAFSAVVSLSGYYRSAVDITTGDLFGGSRQRQDENDLMWRLAHLPAPPISALVTSTRHGESDYQATLAFLAAVKPPMRVSSLILPSGGHNFTTWERELPQALPWLAQELRPPAPLTSADAAHQTRRSTSARMRRSRLSRVKRPG